MGDKKNSMDWGSVAGAGLGMIGSLLQNKKAQDRRQVEQQKRLTNVQTNANKEMADYQQQLGLQMWKDTNFGAQVEEMKKAGLSPSAMLSGTGGGGGATGASVAGAGGGSAADSASTGNADANRIGMALQAANLSLIEAQKRKIDAETNNLESGVPLNESKAEGQSLENQKTKATMNDQIKRIAYEAEQQVQETQKSFNERKISDETYKDEIKRIRNEAIGSGIDNEVKRLGMNLDRRKVNAIEEAIKQGWEKLILERRDVTVRELAQASQAIYMQNSKTQRDNELGQREWEAIGNFALGAAGVTMGAMPTTTRTQGYSEDEEGNAKTWSETKKNRKF